MDGLVSLLVPIPFIIFGVGFGPYLSRGWICRFYPDTKIRHAIGVFISGVILGGCCGIITHNILFDSDYRNVIKIASIALGCLTGTTAAVWLFTFRDKPAEFKRLFSAAAGSAAIIIIVSLICLMSMIPLFVVIDLD